MLQDIYAHKNKTKTYLVKHTPLDTKNEVECYF